MFLIQYNHHVLVVVVADTLFGISFEDFQVSEFWEIQIWK